MADLKQEYTAPVDVVMEEVPLVKPEAAGRSAGTAGFVLVLVNANVIQVSLYHCHFNVEQALIQLVLGQIRQQGFCRGQRGRSSPHCCRISAY